MPIEVSSMQPRNVRNPSCARALEHPPRRADAAALRELDVDAGDDADQRVEVVDGHGALVRDERQRRSRLEPAQVGRGDGPGTAARSAPRRGARAPAAGRRASSGVQPVLASTRIGPPNTARTARTVSRSVGPPTLILSAGKSAARRARSATTAGSSMPSVKSVGGISPVDAEQSRHRQAEPLADEVVEGDVDRALGRAVVADGRRHPAGRVLEGRARGVAEPPRRPAADGLDRLEQDGARRPPSSPASRRSTRPGSPRPRPTGPSAPSASSRSSARTVVARSAGAVRRPRDHERVAQRQDQRPVA